MNAILHTAAHALQIRKKKKSKKTDKSNCTGKGTFYLIPTYSFWWFKREKFLRR